SSVIVLVVAALYRPLAVGAFDPAFLRAVGARAPYEAVFLALVVLALVASFQAFGTLLAVGPMLLPAAAARCWGLGAAASMALAGAARAADRIPVAATFSVIGDMLATIGGDRIDIKTIVGAGGDCELYQPTAADVATVSSARAVFLNDLNEEFESWLEPLLKQALFRGTKKVLTRGVWTLTAEEYQPVAGRHM